MNSCSEMVHHTDIFIELSWAFSTIADTREVNALTYSKICNMFICFLRIPVIYRDALQ
jgi:hypothetical protein